MTLYPVIVDKGITPEQLARSSGVKSEIKCGIPLIIPDLVSKFHMIC
jgi:hypothetical protein